MSFDAAIKLDPSNVVAFNNRGAAYGEKGDFDRAIADYNEAIKLAPGSAVVLTNRGVAYREQGRPRPGHRGLR
jgi:Flp pilus assembly protein TadD